MIIFLNGPFGIGKTSTARELVRLNPNSILFDPELIGSFLRALLGPLANANDYQELPLWRSLTVDLIRRVHTEYGRDLVVPMTIWRRDYFDEIVGGLISTPLDVRCFSLVAARETLIARITGRPEADGPHAWCLAHLDVGLAAANDPTFGEPIATDDLSPAEVTAQIVARIAAETH